MGERWKLTKTRKSKVKWNIEWFRVVIQVSLYLASWMTTDYSMSSPNFSYSSIQSSRRDVYLGFPGGGGGGVLFKKKKINREKLEKKK